MKIYLDLVLFINFFFDFILLLGVKYLLKIKTKWYRIALGGIVGSISILFLFMPLNTFSLFILKLIISILMILTSFGTKNFFKRFLYLYILSIFLGGAMYLLNDTFSYKNKGLVFFSNGLSINFIVMIILTPVIIYLYIKEHKNYKNNISNNYVIDIYINKTKYRLNAYLDTGNTLTDPYKKRGVIITNKKIDFGDKLPIIVPFETINSHGIIKCIKPDKIVINKKTFTNLLVGLSSKKFLLHDRECILPNILKEEL